jgi:hypothetical protein
MSGPKFTAVKMNLGDLLKATGGGALRKTRATTHPIEHLREATAAPNKLTLDARLEIIDDVVQILERQPTDFLGSFGDSPALLDEAVKELKDWRDAINDIASASDPSDLHSLMECNWDSPSMRKVQDPRFTRTGSYVRKAFKHALQRKWWEIVQKDVLVTQKRHGESSGGPPAKRAKKSDDGDDDPKKPEEAAPVVPDEPLD